MTYQPTIGLDVHIELNTKSKMFCSCKNDPDERHPNINVCPICLGHPGTLPVINKEAVRKVIKTGLALNCQIPEYSKFDRKNYFYPDLPKGYQISQLYQPLCIKGFLEVKEDKSSFSPFAAARVIDGRKIRIREVHLEEDTGSSVHPENAQYSLVDFNRAGIPLMELATEPDIHSAEEARKFAEELHLIMHYLEVSDADMEKGEMRVEVNISLSKNPPAGGGKLGTKVEIKNLNSFRAVERSIEYEIKRQTEILGKGGKIIQETRGWLDEATVSSRRVAGARVDDVKGKTVSQREKEEAHDYKYFPEPDLPPLHHSKEFVDGIRAEIPELPQQRRERFSKEYQLDEKNIEIFVYNKDLGEYFEKVVSEFGSNLPKKKLYNLIKTATNYLITDLQGQLKGVSVTDKRFLIMPENFSEFCTLIVEGVTSSTIAKTVLKEMVRTGADPSHIIEEKDLSQITDEAEIEKIIKEVISKNPKVVEDYKKGKENAFQFLIGQVMAKTKGKANPELTNKVLREILTKIK
jgi:aspartyl-tRNA(Asn)/glutamyl-tRNA(Gln) amidotransferase subunit B